MSHQVEDTAFVIAYYRAQDVDFSKDPYANLWSNEGAKKIALEFQEQVSVYDGLLHCARNRFIRDTLEKNAIPKNDSLIINIGAGFSMYPFVLDSEIQHIEVDLPNVVAFKSEKLNRFVENGDLPNRNIYHASFNITNKTELDKLQTFIETVKVSKKIIILEGLLFFLSLEEVTQLLEFCNKVLSKGDIVICESYERNIENTDVYKRLLNFFGNDFTLQTQKHATLPHSFYRHIDGFNLIEHTSTYDVSKLLHKIPATISEIEVLNEHMYVLQKL